MELASFRDWALSKCNHFSMSDALHGPEPRRKVWKRRTQRCCVGRSTAGSEVQHAVPQR